MNVNTNLRTYDNSYRIGQAAQTRIAILDGLVRVLARGVAELSIPAVAREAGVSTRTVYRNFPTKRDLLDALDEHLDARIGYRIDPNLAGPDELIGHIREYFLALDGMDDAVRAARMNPIAKEARQNYAGALPLKHQAVENALAPITHNLDPTVRQYLVNAAFVLFSQYTLQRMKDDLALSGAQAADTVAWVLQACIAAARNAVREDANHERPATIR